VCVVHTLKPPARTRTGTLQQLHTNIGQKSSETLAEIDCSLEVRQVACACTGTHRGMQLGHQLCSYCFLCYIHQRCADDRRHLATHGGSSLRSTPDLHGQVLMSRRFHTGTSGVRHQRVQVSAPSCNQRAQILEE
jgi:hypothetical protein